MNFAESIKKARESGLSDDQILDAIKKQNPQKEDFFNKKAGQGITPTQILDEIIGGGNKEVSNHLNSNPLTPEIKARIPQRPAEETKLWTRIFITLSLLTIATLSVTLLYRSFFVPRLRPIHPEVIVHEIQTPRAANPLVKLYPERDHIHRFAITVDDEYKLYLKSLARDDRSGEFMRVIVDDQREGVRNARIANFEDFFKIFNIKYPENFFEKISKDFNLFIYTGESPGKLAFISTFDREARDDVEYLIMRHWEKAMTEDFNPFFNFWNESIEKEGDFRETTYQGNMLSPVSIRYKEGTGGFGIYYALTNTRILFGTSLESIQIIIERNYQSQN